MAGTVSTGARSNPERTCVGCGRRRPQAELIRVSGGRRGLEVHLERGEGRGAYLCPDLRCVERTVKQKALQKALGAEVRPLSVPQLREAIHRAVLQKIERLLGLARRARKIVVGSKAVKHALGVGWVRLVLVCRDDEEKVPGMDKHIREEAQRRRIPVKTVFSWDELTGVLGGLSRGIVALSDDGFAAGIMRTLEYWIPVSNEGKPGRSAQERRTGGGTRE